MRKETREAETMKRKEQEKETKETSHLTPPTSSNTKLLPIALLGMETGISSTTRDSCSRKIPEFNSRVEIDAYRAHYSLKRVDTCKTAMDRVQCRVKQSKFISVSSPGIAYTYSQVDIPLRPSLTNAKPAKIAKVAKWRIQLLAFRNSLRVSGTKGPILIGMECGSRSP